MTWAHASAVAGGAALGGLLRWGAGVWLNALWVGFPLGTLVVNGVGGLLVGASMAWFTHAPSELLRLLLVTGLLGGFTTFSSFSAESLILLQEGRYGLAALHTLAHVGGALAGAGIGFASIRLALF